MVGLLRTLLIIATIWMVVRILRLYVFPWLVRRAAGKMQDTMQQRMEDMMRQQNQQHDQRGEGDVRVERKRKPGQGPQLNDDAGEYVDFEEVDD